MTVSNLYLYTERTSSDGLTCGLQGSMVVAEILSSHLSFNYAALLKCISMSTKNIYYHSKTVGVSVVKLDFMDVYCFLWGK